MSPAMKRPAAATVALGKAAKKAKTLAKPAAKKVEAPVKAPKRDARLQKVDAGIKQSDLPAEAKQMLIDMAPTVLLVNKQDRDERLQRVVEMFASTLEGVRTAIDSDIQDCQRLADEAQGIQAQQHSAIEGLASELEAQNSESKKRKYALAEVARAFRAAREELEGIQREAKDHDKEIGAVAEKKATLEASVVAHFKPLLAELPEAELAKAEVEKLCADLAEANFNDSLISTLPTALLKAPDTRGSFDMMVLSQFESEVSSRIADYTKRLDEADSIKAQRGQRLDAAQRILDAAKKEQLQAAEAFTKAKDEEKRREEALGEAKHKGSDLKKLVKSLSDRLHKAQRSLEVFNDGPMAAFAKLRELAPVVEEVMDLEAEGEAEAAEDAEESAEGAVAMEQEPVVA